MERPEQRLPGLDAIATPGDLMLSNGYVRAFFDAPEHPHHLATSGGSLLDFAPVDGTDLRTIRLPHRPGAGPGHGPRPGGDQASAPAPGVRPAGPR